MQPTHTPAAQPETQPAPASPEPVTTVARILRDAGRYLFLHGWIQGAYYDDSTGSFTPRCCLVGAVGMVCYGGPVDAPAQHFDDPGFGDFEAAVAYLDAYIVDRYGFDSVYTFNDAKGHTLGDVLVLLTEAAARWELERLLELEPAHPGQPHTPGTLAGCPLCDRWCYCTRRLECVGCLNHTAQDTPPTTGGGAE